MARRPSPTPVAVLAWLIGCTCLTLPIEAADTTAERSRIDSQRVAANAALAEQERACQARFLVAPCVEAARKQQRAVLTRLRTEELVLDEAQRSETAARRRQTLLDKAAARDARPEAAEPGAAQRAANHSASTPSAPASARADVASEPRTRNSAADRARRAALEEESTAKFEARAQSALAHREAVEQRNAQRAAAGKRAAPLPLPAAASAAVKAGSAS